MRYYQNYCRAERRSCKDESMFERVPDEIDKELVKYYTDSIEEVSKEIAKVDGEVREIFSDIHSKNEETITSLVHKQNEIARKYNRLVDEYLAICIAAKSDPSKVPQITDMIAIMNRCNDESEEVGVKLAEIKNAERNELAAVITENGKWQQLESLNTKKIQLEMSSKRVIKKYSSYVHSVKSLLDNGSYDNAKVVIEEAEYINGDDDENLKVLLPWYIGKKVYLCKAERVINSHLNFDRMTRARVVHPAEDQSIYTDMADPFCRQSGTNVYINDLCDSICRYGSISITNRW